MKYITVLFLISFSCLQSNSMLQKYKELMGAENGLTTHSSALSKKNTSDNFIDIINSIITMKQGTFEASVDFYARVKKSIAMLNRDILSSSKTEDDAYSLEARIFLYIKFTS